MTAPPPSNRLGAETSPYLRQHAHNPVDWYPWGEAARSRARSEDRPLLLSIGYSACHWCHVMERESFDDPETARMMNEGFVCVKVDREERPDVDAIYMRAVQALTGHGGWPLTVFLTPEGLPFFGGTYFPPQPRHGMPSFRQVLAAARAAWDERRGEVEGAAERILDLLRRSAEGESGAGGEGGRGPGGEGGGGSEGGGGRGPQGGAGGGPEGAFGNDARLTPLLRGSTDALLRTFDATHGGFGRAPKFPQPAVLEFLLHEHHFTGDPALRDAAFHTLRRMAAGGMRDHLGGGFHRYSVDARWLVPHFEKMLYDNALLASVYLRAHQLSGDPDFETVCRATLDDLLDDFRSPGGAFYSARDADSEGEEGTFHVWTRGQIEAVLGEESALFCRVYGVTDGGNFEGKNILHLPQELAAAAPREGIPLDELEQRMEAARASLFQARKEREPPFLDTKLLTGWNGLAIRAFAEAGAALGERRFLDAAEAAALHLLRGARPEGRLLHQVPESDARIPAFLEDLAALGLGVLALHEATLEPRWLNEAVAMAEEIELRFRDPESGRLFDTPHDGERLVIRPREIMDNAVPSGNSMAAELHLRLARLLDRPEWEAPARAHLEREAANLDRYPAGFGRALAVASRLLRPSLEVAITGERASPEVQALLDEVHRDWRPDAVVTGGAEEDYPFPMPLLVGRTGGGHARAWVCKGHVCRAPCEDPGALREALEGS